jgi:hypothetical protein
MPDSSGYFSEDDRKKISEWVEMRSKGGYNCHCCGNREFRIFSHLVQMPIATDSGANLKTGYEAVGIGCDVCGNLAWFDADTIGVGTSAPVWDPVKDGGKEIAEAETV